MGLEPRGSSMIDMMADLLVVLHLGWVCFMAAGTLVTLLAPWRRTWLLGSWRTVHLAGMILAGALSVTGGRCPLTTLEYALRGHATDPGGQQGFMVRWAERLIFPDLSAATLAVVTLLAGGLALSIYVWMPPGRARRLQECGQLNPRTGRPTSP